MGTRSLTFVYEGRKKLVCIYQQYDGYPSGVGAELAEFLDGRHVCNGFGGNTPEKASNGGGCMAASLVSELKGGIGGTYLYPTNTKDAGQDYEYHIYVNGTGDGVISVKVKEYGGKVIFNGNVQKFKEFCANN